MLGGSSLEDYDDFNVQVWFKQMLEMSVVYTTLTRLGYNPKEYLDKADFSVVLDFNTPYTITQLGTATADMTWRPSDIEQREGRILRQGNENRRVDIFRYVTENTFDSYM